jgi:hypothetical protein
LFDRQARVPYPRKKPPTNTEDRIRATSIAVIPLSTR